MHKYSNSIIEKIIMDMINPELATRLYCSPRKKIFVLANPDFYLDGLLAVLSQSTESEVVACVKPGDDCWNKFMASGSDILLVHEQALKEPLVTITRHRQHSPELKVLVFGHHMTENYLLQIVRAGADGYLNENMNGDHLVQAISKICNGEMWVERKILEKLMFRVVELEQVINSAIENIRNVLTKREAEIYKLVLEGLSTKEIATEMNVSEQGVKLHLRNIFKKFDVTNRQQLLVLTFQKVCPVANVLRLFRIVMDKNRMAHGQAPYIEDPLQQLDSK